MADETRKAREGWRPIARTAIAPDDPRYDEAEAIRAWVQEQLDALPAAEVWAVYDQILADVRQRVLYGDSIEGGT